jgi:hypothetical protein
MRIHHTTFRLLALPACLLWGVHEWLRLQRLRQFMRQ